MADKKFPVHYANFICHFGEAELLDYVDEIVVPAFTAGGVRTFKDGKYLFNSVEVLNLGAGKGHSELAVCGRFIKDMVVRSEQRYDSKTETVLPDNQKMETAPSAVFVLLLASHKLIYLSETAHAPGLESFRSTVASFLGKARLAYIADVQDRSAMGTLTSEEAERFPPVEKESEPDGEEVIQLASIEDGALKKLTKKRLLALLPPAELEIVALSNDERV